MMVLVVMMVVVAMIGVVVMMVVVAMILAVVMMVLMVVFFFFIPYVYRGLVSFVITIDNKTKKRSYIVCINAVHCLICSLRILFPKI